MRLLAEHRCRDELFGDARLARQPGLHLLPQSRLRSGTSAVSPGVPAAISAVGCSQEVER
ncbi:hypothetical protein X945_6025 [Burkholderia pseudomallei ABCPW 107]|nr:hypothetical protein X945_6025 [Burkholderia pseudomallei ABCPW 107]